MTLLTRYNLSIRVRAACIHRHGTISKAAQALDMDVRDLCRAWTKTKSCRMSFDKLIILLYMLDYDVQFTTHSRKGYDNGNEKEEHALTKRTSTNEDGRISS